MTRTKRRTELCAGFTALLVLLLPAVAGAQPEPPEEAEEPEPAAEPEPAPAPVEEPAIEAAPAEADAEPGLQAQGPAPAVTRPAPAAGPVDRPDEAEATTEASQRSPRAHSDFMDTRLTWTFGDDDFTHQTGEVIPLSPNANVGDRSQYRLFFDSLNSRFAGRENITHLVLYNKLPGYIEDLTTEAALVLRLDMAALASQSNNVNSVLEDAGTYIRLFYETGGDADDPEGLGLTFYPIDTDRFRLGYLYDISWGGTNARINQSIFPRLQGSAPGAKAQYTGDGWYFFGGFKTATIVEVQQRIIDDGSGEGAATDTVRVAETNYGFLGGAGVDFTDNFRLDVGSGYFQQGRFEEPDVLGERVYTFGFSGRLVVHDGMPVPRSADFLLYRNDPNAPVRMFEKGDYDGGVAWSLAAEVTQLHQNLKDFDAPGATDIQLARAGAVQGNIRVGNLRTSLSAIYRDLPFVLRNQPSFIPFQTIPDAAQTEDEMFFAVATDYYIESFRLTPGVGAGLQVPATFRSESQFNPESARSIVVREQGNLAFLPAGEERVPILQARASLKWDLSGMMSTVAWLQYRRDNNATRLETDPGGTVYLRQFVSPNFLGFGTSIQARF